HHLGRIADRCEVVDLVPLLQQTEVGHQGVHLRIAQAKPQRLQPIHQYFPACTGCIHHRAHAAPSASTATVAKPLKPPCFKWIISSEMLAGVIPEMREACPRVSGRCWASFCRASNDNALTCR